MLLSCSTGKADRIVDRGIQVNLQIIERPTSLDNQYSISQMETGHYLLERKE